MAKKNKILITGGDGMVGSQVDFGIRLNHKKLDILNKNSIQKAINHNKPDVILHLAAMTQMLSCEENPKKAYKINVIGTKNIAEVCKKNKVKLVYMSTCAVFNGKKKTAFTERDVPHPLNVYGKTKLLGEKVAQKILEDTLIIRTGWLFGQKKNTKKDIKFVGLTFQKLKRGEEVRATFDRRGSPTYIPDLLKALKNLIEKNKTGLHHVVNSGVASYFEVAKEIKKVGKFKTKVSPIKAHDIENPKLKRGKIEALASSKIELDSWKNALKSYISILKRG